jgi:DNA polymerase gamma 1
MNKAIPADVVTTGAITGRTSGLQVTLANPKPRKIGTEIKSLMQSTRGSNNHVVSFDFSGQEMTIVAAYNAVEHCNRNWLPLEALSNEGSKAVFLGRAKDGTDFHTVAANDVGIERNHSKTLSFSLLYGAGKASCCNLLRPLIPGISESELNTKVVSYIKYLKGDKIRGKFYGGMFSDFFNYADSLIKEDQPKLPFGGQAITNTLTPTNSSNDYYTSKMNWSVQASGSALLDYLGTLIDTEIFRNGFEDLMWFQFSVHDQLSYVCDENYEVELADIIRDCYAKTWRNFFKALGLTCPIEVQQNIIITSDTIDRKEPDSQFPTSSAPEWLMNIENGHVI